MRKKNYPYLTAKQMKKVDELAVEHNLFIIQMMENAGYQMADFIRQKHRGKKKILALAGKGGNGGDALAAARHLINWGYEVMCILSSSSKDLKKEASQQYKILTSIKANAKIYFSISNTTYFDQCDLIIDGLLGYSVKSNPRPPINEMIDKANQSGKPIISFDLPSGMDATTGDVYQPTIKATDTLTLALPKTCFQNTETKEYVGNLYLVDISVPTIVYQHLSLKIPSLFSKESIVKIEK